MRIFSVVACIGLLAFAHHTCASSRSHTAARTGVESGQSIPQGYYSAIDGLQGSSLKVALGSIISEHEVLPYSELWYHYEYTDVVPGTENQVFDYYSPEVYYFTGTGTNPSGANKEHCCPQSWWGKGATCNCYSDLFNVMPSESDANSAKSNFPLGIVGSTVTYSNGRITVGESARSEYDGKVFEPCDEFKGDFARIYFYVATCYANAAWGSSASVASTCPFTQEDYPTIQSWLLPLLMQWNAQDPVSEWEVIRNGRVYDEQRNRNPFIDYPQLADYIWGDSAQFAFDLEHALVNGSASGATPGGIPDTPDPTPDDGGEDDPYGDGESAIGTILLDEDFASAAAGNDTETTGQGNTLWEGNDNFPSVSNIFQAGGAVKLGSSSKLGSLTSRPLGNAAGTSLTVEIYVKGWTKLEGLLQVLINGGDPVEVAYDALMSDPYQLVTVTLPDCPANAELTIAHSAKRCFLTQVRVGITGSEQAISAPRSDVSSFRSVTYTLLGHRLAEGCRGIRVSDGRLLLLQ